MERKLDFCRYETRLLTKDGKFRWVEVYAQLSFNSDGSILGASGSLTDITDRKRAEQEIQKLAAFPQVNPNPVLEFDGEGKVTYFNEAAAALARSLGQTQPLSILPPDSMEIARRCLATGSNNLRREITMAGRTISWSFFPIVASRVVHCYGSDITETLNLEAQFRHSQKLESVGQLAAGVAHDFNNILTIIQGYADSLLTRYGAEPGFSGPLKQISDASKRASALTRQLLMFSRKQAIQLKVLDLNVVLRNLSNLLSRLLGEHIMIESQFAPDLPAIEADTGMIEQIVMNLAVNARDAMPKGGRLVISTSAADISPEYVRRHPKAVEGRAVRLTVRDTGCGMNRATLSRIFEPFFSTKEVGKGTGLGLATVYGIVTQHRGWIDVKSEVDVGTTFEIFLPVAAAGLAPTTEAPPPVTGAAAKGGNETILLVEDEPTLREFVREILSDHGYRVVEAGSGIEALKMWGQLGGRVDLLLTDMVMPEGITGRELALQLKSRDPALKIIFTSGYSTELMTKDPELLDVPLLSKPYLPPQLIQLVRTCLDAPARAHSASSAAP
jgi:signal transduction histidine kinase/CheY-like chemotaxis protein